MIRKVKGIKEESPSKEKKVYMYNIFVKKKNMIFSGTVLSKEALDKMGIGIKSLTKEEEQAKVNSSVQDMILIVNFGFLETFF
jgi:hypothetical protein